LIEERQRAEGRRQKGFIPSPEKKINKPNLSAFPFPLSPSLLRDAE
jgi:hypothetical protein